MEPERSIQRYRSWYRKLLRLHAKPHRERFSEGMEQTFADLLRERAEEGRGLLGCAAGLFAETLAGIMKENIRYAATHHRNILRLALATGGLLLVPLVATQFTREVTWSAADFALAGGLLFGTGLAYELIAKRMGRLAGKLATILALGTALLLVWINLAVGIIGSENNPANLIYVGVLAVLVLGVAKARLRPYGMAHALFATALAQTLVAGVILAVGDSSEKSFGVVLGANAFFAGLFLVSAWLFRRASVTASPSTGGDAILRR